jgi:hypothetical protein
MLSAREPEWEPLLNFAADHVVDFMWMYTVELTDGTRLQAYKHYWTRDYLHLDTEGRAFVYAGKERYEEVNPPWLLRLVLREELESAMVSDKEFPRDPRDEPRRSILGHVRGGEGMANVRKPKAGEEAPLGGTRSGTVITEELAEQWAEEFERNPPDPSEFERRYVGRPSLGTAGRSPRVSFRASPKLFKAAWKRADAKGRSLSSLARDALERYLKS